MSMKLDSAAAAAKHSESQSFSRRQFGALTLGSAVVSVLPSAASAATEGVGRNIALVRQMVLRGFIQGDLTVADEICAKKVSEHEYLADSGHSGPENLKTAIRETRKAIRDLQIEIEDFVETGSKVWTRSICRGIEPSTGKPFVMTVFDQYRFEGGKLVEHWGVPDRFAMLHQLGLLPTSSG